MNPQWLPWLRLWWAWIPALVLVAGNTGFLIWQISGPGGRQGQIVAQVEELESGIERLERMVDGAEAERRQVAATGERLDEVFDSVFDRYEERLTAVIREVGEAVRAAGMFTATFSYGIEEVEEASGLKFNITFSVLGTYDQVTEMLQRLQASPEFLIVERISFRGEEDPRSRELGISLEVSTFFSEVESGRLEALARRLQLETTATGEE